MEKRKVAVICGVAGAIVGVTAGVAKLIVKKQEGERKPEEKPGRVWEA